MKHNMQYSISTQSNIGSYLLSVVNSTTKQFSSRCPQVHVQRMSYVAPTIFQLVFQIKAIFINELGNNIEIESDTLSNAHPRIALSSQHYTSFTRLSSNLDSQWNILTHTCRTNMHTFSLLLFPENSVRASFSLVCYMISKEFLWETRKNEMSKRKCIMKQKIASELHAVQKTTRNNIIQLC